MNSLSIKLKEETSHLHHMIENVPIFRNLMSPALTLEKYSDLIRQWYFFVKPLEENILMIQQIDTLLIDLADRFKTPLLENDLVNLKAKTDQPLTTELIPKCSSIEECIGILYVMEGSTLGSQIISKKLLKHDFIDSSMLSFYLGYEEKTGLYWRKFKSVIDQWGLQNKEKHIDVVNSAQSCFSNLALHMEKLSTIKPKLH